MPVSPPRRGDEVDAPAAPEIAPVRPGEDLDWQRLSTWLRPRLAELLPAVTGRLEVLQFPNGSANLTYLLRLGSHGFGILQALHVVFGLFYALLVVCAVRGLSLHALGLWRSVREMGLGAKPPIEHVELRMD